MIQFDLISPMETTWKEFDYHTWKEENDKYDHSSRDEAISNVDCSSFESIIQSFAEIHKKYGSPPFAPFFVYNKEADSIEILISRKSYYAKWLNHSVSVLIAHNTEDEIVGIVISGVKRTMESDNVG